MGAIDETAGLGAGLVLSCHIPEIQGTAVPFPGEDGLSVSGGEQERLLGARPAGSRAGKWSEFELTGNGGAGIRAGVRLDDAISLVTGHGGADQQHPGGHLHGVREMHYQLLLIGVYVRGDDAPDRGGRSGCTLAQYIVRRSRHNQVTRESRCRLAGEGDWLQDCYVPGKGRYLDREETWA